MSTDRLEAFSDGVMAIAITLLVLEITVPAHDRALGPALVALWPSYVAYIISFVVIGAIWINHHAMFRYIVRADGMLVLLNVLHLMLIAFLPFPTAVLADAFSRGSDELVAAAFYGGTLTLLGILINVMWRYAAHGHRLLGSHVSRGQARQMGRRYLVGPIGYAIATLAALMVPWLALAIFFFLNLFYLWPRKRATPNTESGRSPGAGFRITGTDDDDRTMP
jgi:uncharacterized membrane protein